MCFREREKKKLQQGKTSTLRNELSLAPGPQFTAMHVMELTFLRLCDKGFPFISEDIQVNVPTQINHTPTHKLVEF